jgi:Kinesin motor domain
MRLRTTSHAFRIGVHLLCDHPYQLPSHDPCLCRSDSKLTRLVAEALGGRCKTAIIATVAPGSMNAQESASTLKYAERAKSALNTTQLSKTQVLEAKLTRLAQLYKELQTDMQNEREMFEQERQFMTRTHNQHLEMLRKQRREEVTANLRLLFVSLVLRLPLVVRFNVSWTNVTRCYAKNWMPSRACNGRMRHTFARPGN